MTPRTNESYEAFRARKNAYDRNREAGRRRAQAGVRFAGEHAVRTYFDKAGKVLHVAAAKKGDPVNCPASFAALTVEIRDDYYPTQQEAEAKMAQLTWQKPTPERRAELDAQLKKHAADVNQLTAEILEIEARRNDRHCEIGECWIELRRRLGENGFRAELRKHGLSVRDTKAAMRMAERARVTRSAEEQTAFEERLFPGLTGQGVRAVFP